MPHLSSFPTFSVCILLPASSHFSHCSPSSFYITATPPFSPTVAPDTINNHVKTCHEEQKNFHFYAPEYGGRTWAEPLFLLVPAISWLPGETRWTHSEKMSEDITFQNSFLVKCFSQNETIYWHGTIEWGYGLTEVFSVVVECHLRAVSSARIYVN